MTAGTPATDPPLLAADSIVSGYGDMEILHGVSLDVAAGEIVAVIGPNGCGKSTLRKVLCGLLPAWAGTVRLDGRAVTGDSPRARLLAGIGYVPQVQGVFGNMTVAENLRMGQHALAGGDRRARTARVLELLPALRDFLHQRAGTLSGGQQQLAAIGRALVAAPRVLLLDEPSAGLAPRLVQELFAHVHRISRDSGTAVVLVEQNARAALAVADRCCILAEGRNRLDGSAAAILADAEIGRIYLGGDA